MSHCYEPDKEHQPLQGTIICNLCVHKYPGRKCKAFPDEIPMEILRNNSHFKSIPGDNGIVFKAKR